MVLRKFDDASEQGIELAKNLESPGSSRSRLHREEVVVKMKKRDDEHLPRKENERIRQQIVKENRRSGTKRKNMVQEKPNRPNVGVPNRSL